jgi:mannose-6-phosphate isomerase-like protein (cupin superfamily)
MMVALEGGCLVTNLREGEPRIEGNLKIWHHIGRHTGAEAISLRVLEFGEGLSKGLPNRQSDEVLYVFCGSGKILIDGQAYEMQAETGIYIRPEQTFAVENPHTEALVLISVRCPEPEVEAPFVNRLMASLQPSTASEGLPMVRLADRKALPTADRWYRVLVDDEIGSTQVTQFVGSIPPGRAPDHFHTYEEVLLILRGEGRMWAGATSTPIAAGSCLFLPKKQIHCVENTGAGELRLLGVFYPAGSPAVRYDAR